MQGKMPGKLPGKCAGTTAAFSFNFNWPNWPKHRAEQTQLVVEAGRRHVMPHIILNQKWAQFRAAFSEEEVSGAALVAATMHRQLANTQKER